MRTYEKEYTIEWVESCEADSFAEAEEILDKLAEKRLKYGCLDIIKSSEVEMVFEDDE